MIHIEISKGAKWELLVIPSLGSRMDSLLISKMTCDKTHGVSPTQEAHLSLGAEILFRLSHADMADHLRGLPPSPAPAEVELIPYGPRPHRNHIVRPASVTQSSQGNNTLFRRIKLKVSNLR